MITTIKIALRVDEVADIQLALKERICRFYGGRNESSGIRKKLCREAIATLRTVNNANNWELVK